MTGLAGRTALLSVMVGRRIGQGEYSNKVMMMAAGQLDSILGRDRMIQGLSVMLNSLNKMLATLRPALKVLPNQIPPSFHMT